MQIKVRLNSSCPFIQSFCSEKISVIIQDLSQFSTRISIDNMLDISVLFLLIPLCQFSLFYIGKYFWGTLLHCWWEYKLVQSLWRTVWRFLNKLKIELPYDLAMPLLGIYPEKNIVQKDTHTPVFITTLFTIAKTRKQPKCPSTEEWMRKTQSIYAMDATQT